MRDRGEWGREKERETHIEREGERERERERERETKTEIYTCMYSTEKEGRYVWVMVWVCVFGYECVYFGVSVGRCAGVCGGAGGSSIETLHSRQLIFTPFFHTFCMYCIPACQDIWNYYLLLLTFRWQCNQVSMLYPGSARLLWRPNYSKGLDPGYYTTNGTTVWHIIHCSIPSPIVFSRFRKFLVGLCYSPEEADKLTVQSFCQQMQRFTIEYHMQYNLAQKERERQLKLHNKMKQTNGEVSKSHYTNSYFTKAF